MDNSHKRKKLIIGSIVFIFFAIGCLIYYYYRMSFLTTSIAISDENSKTPTNSLEIEKNNIQEENAMNITVHVAGAVKNPGIYVVPSDSRVNDVILMAGGATEDADLNEINLASYIDDEEQIYVPTIDENENKIEKGTMVVNINIATQEELMTLPGVGEVTAQNIIKYRDANGGFKSKEEIMNVPGIGDKTYEQMESFIAVE